MRAAASETSAQSSDAMKGQPERLSDPTAELLHRSLATQRAIESHAEAFADLISHRAKSGDPDGHRRLTSWVNALQDFVFMEAALLISAIDELDIETGHKPQVDAELRSRVRLMRNILLHSSEIRRELDEGQDGGRSASSFAELHEPVSFRSQHSPAAGARMGGVEFRELVELAAAAEALAWDLVRGSEIGEFEAGG